MRGMKVCLITGYSPRDITGVGKVVVSLGRGLLEGSHEYVILTKSSKELGPGMSGLVEVNYREIKFIGGLLLVLGALVWLLKERKSIDILHLHSISWLTATCALMGAALGKPRILTLHGRLPMPTERFPSALFRLSQKLVFALSDTKTCVSLDAKRHYELNSAVVIPNGIDILQFRQDPEIRRQTRLNLGLDGSFVLLFVGRLDISKGIRELIETAGRLVKENPDLKILLVGSGEDELVRMLLMENSLENHAIMVGRIDNTVPYYQCSDLYVLFSSFEGIPLTLLEAMACGLPCVATSVGGIPEVLIDNVNGYVVKPGDREGLNRVISHVLKNKEGVEKLSENARRTIEQRFSSSRMVEGYLGLYESLIKT